MVKGTMSRDFLPLVFFHESVSPQPQSIPLLQDRFEFFRKFAEIFASKGAPPVSTTTVASNGNNIRLHLKVNLKAKIYLYVNSTSQRCPNNITKIFLIEDFFHLPAVSRHWWCTLSCEYLREFSKKNQNGPNGIFRGLGETDS